MQSEPVDITIPENQLSAHEQRYFAMLHAAVAIIGDDELEGGNYIHAINYYDYLLHLNIPNYPTSLQLEKTILEKLQLHIQKLKDIAELIGKNPLSQELVAQVIQHIKQCCEQMGSCYLPGGWCNSRGSSHFAGLKVRKLANGDYAFSIINHGSGIQYHTTLGNSGYKVKRAYQSDEFIISFKLEQSASLFFNTLITLITTPPHAESNPYGADDLYGLLMIHSDRQTPPENIQEKSVTGQRSGTCTMTNLNGIGRDVLVDLNHEMHLRKRFQFDIKLKSLIAGYDSFKQGRYSLVMVEWALREFSVRVLKHRHLLSDQEMQYAAGVQATIQSDLDNARQQMLVTLTARQPFPNLHGDHVYLPRTAEKAPLPPENSYRNERAEEQTIEIPTLRPDNVIEYITTLAKIAEKSSGHEYLKKIYQLFTSLPVCSGEATDSFWDQVPEKDLVGIIRLLNNKVSPSEAQDRRWVRSISFATALIAYDICAQLLPRVASYKLTDQYALALDDVYSQQCLFSDAKSFYVIKRVIENFEKRCDGKKRIFSNEITGNPYDHTVDYVMDVLLTREQKQRIIRDKEADDDVAGIPYSNLQLFNFFMETMQKNSGRLYTSRNYVEFVGLLYQPILSLASGAHLLGWIRTKNRYGHFPRRANPYESIHYDLSNFRFGESQFHKELASAIQTRRKQRPANDVHLKFPSVQRSPNQFQDFSENSLFIPSASQVAARPYSGSLKAESQTWEVSAEQQQTFAALNEELSQIGCSPNLQIVRTLSWATTHLSYLKYASIQKTIENYLFEYGRLDAALFKQFDLVVMHLTRFFAAFIQHNSSQSNKTIESLIWFANTSSELRAFVSLAAKMYQYSTNHIQLPSSQLLFISELQNHRSSDERYALAVTLISSYEYRNNMELSMLCEILAARIVANLEYFEATLLEQGSQFSADIIRQFNENPNLAIQLLNENLVRFHVMPAPAKWQLRNNKLVNDAGLQIDLQSGVLLDPAGNQAKERTHFIINKHRKAFEELGLSESNITIWGSAGNKRLYSADGIWEFEECYDNLYLYQKLTINSTSEFFLKVRGIDIRDIYNPLHSEDTHLFYEYWVCCTNINLIFARDRADRNVAYLIHSAGKEPGLTQPIQVLQITDQQQWRQTERVMLNLLNPESQLEKLWHERLKPMFGTKNIRVTAKKNSSDDSYSIEKIEHLTLGLTFQIQANNQFACQEFPGFHWSTQLSIIQLQGIRSVVILEDDAGHQRFIIPAFKFVEAKGSSQFDTETIIDDDHLCNHSQPYYVYHLNEQQQLESDSVEANLYLALLLRCKADFQQAIHYVDQCRTNKKLTPEALAISAQVRVRKMNTAFGAAFDLKLECLVLEQGKKWDKATFPSDPAKESNGENERNKLHLKKQIDLYKACLSDFKKGISIMPDYLRLTARELLMLSFEENTLWVKEISTTSPHPYSISLLSLPRFSVMSSQFEANDPDYGPAALIYALVYEETNVPSEKYGTRYRPLDYVSDVELEFRIISSNFREWFEDARSENRDRELVLRARLFQLLQNSQQIPRKNTILAIATLFCVTLYPKNFERIDVKTALKEFMTAVVRGVYSTEYDKQLFGRRIEINNYMLPITNQSSLPSDLSPIDTEFLFNTTAFEQALQAPLVALGQSNFLPSSKSIAKRAFPLTIAGLGEDASRIEKKLLEQYKKGHEDNRKKFKNNYELNADAQLVNLKKELELIKESDQQSLKAILERLKKANWTPLDNPTSTVAEKARAFNLLQSRAAGIQEVIRIDHLIEAFLRQDSTILTKNNPFLTQEMVTSLFTDLADYLLINNRIAQANDCLALIDNKKEFSEFKPYQLQLLAYNLNKKRHYDIHLYPEFLVYESATQQMLRQDQVETLIKIFKLIENNATDEYQHALLQFAAGGGKTSVLIPILAQRIARKGLLPVIFNTNELYQIGSEEIPKNLHRSFRQHMEVVERELNHQWTDVELVQLLGDLELCRQQRKCLLLKPVTWHAINITRKLALLDDNMSLAAAASDVLDFFKNKSVKLEDECQIVSDPLLKSIKTSGTLLKMPSESIHIIKHCYKLLFQDPNIAQLAGLKENRKREITATELDALKNALADKLCKLVIFEKFPADTLKTYLTQASTQRPDELKKLFSSGNVLDRRIANAIVAARAFIQTHFPHILTLQYLKDFGPSIYEGDLTAAPKHEGKDVHAHFADHSLVASLTIQLYQQRGLNEAQVILLLNRLILLHENERVWNSDTQFPTEIEAMLLTMIPNDYPVHSMADINQSVITLLSKDVRFQQDPTSIQLFVTHFALPQIQIPSQQQTSSAAEFQAGFKRSVAFSATPSLKEQYPIYLKREHCYLQEGFEAQVIETLFDDANRGVCELNECKTPRDFFKQLPLELRQRMTTLIDRGSLFTHFDPLQVITDFLADSDLTAMAAYFSREDMRLAESSDTGIKETRIKGAGLITELKKRGIAPEEFILFLFLDLSKTTGTDIKRPFKDHAGLTIGPTQTVTETIQAAMRERQLLEDDAQTITWIIFTSLYQQIAGTSTFDPAKLFYWFIKNEATQIHSKILHRAYQGIEAIIERVVWQATFDSPNPELTNALRQNRVLDSYLLYELEHQVDATEKVLQGYVKHLLNDVYQFPKHNLSLTSVDEDRINLIVSETAALIATAEQPQSLQLNAEVVQEVTITSQQEENQQQQQREQNKLLNQNNLATDFEFTIEQYSFPLDNLENIFLSPQHYRRYQLLRLPETGGIQQPALLICPAHFQAFRIHGTEKKNEIQQIKPIKVLLLQVDKQVIRYLACTAAGADYYRGLIDLVGSNANNPAYILMSSEGLALYHSANISLQQVQKSVDELSTKKILAYINFLNGKISDPENLSLIAKEFKWSFDDYQILVKSVFNIQLTQSVFSLKDNTTFEVYCGWRAAPESSAHSRYRPFALQDASLVRQQSLARVEDVLPTSSPPIVVPQHALYGYIFGIEPKPVLDLKNDHPIEYRLERLRHLKIDPQEIERLLEEAKGFLDKPDVVERLDKQFAELETDLNTQPQEPRPERADPM